MTINPLLAIDFYKVDHRRQYPEGTTEIYSNFTPRYVKPCHSIGHKFDNQVVVFGIQWFIKKYLIDAWNEEFFMQDKETVVDDYRTIMANSLGIDDFDCSHIEALHDLGYLPIRIKAIVEGSRVPIGVPVLSIINTLPDFAWITNYLETMISAALWKPITVATIAFEFKRLMTEFAIETGCPENVPHFQVHDFSFRGMSGIEDAAICGAAHLTSFLGTDCVPAIQLLNESYDAECTVEVVGSSVPATEHSVMCANGEVGEFATIKRLITEVYPDGIVSIVADTYSFWHVLRSYLPSLYAEIMARPGKVVIRPDSGDPYKIITGDCDAPDGSPAYKGALLCLWETFGGRVNEAGFRELDSHIGLIYGDAITLHVANNILLKMRMMGFASSNIVFGVGSYSYQYITRDTFGFAMKATSAVVNGERRELFKDPITADGSKRSAKGLLRVGIDHETSRYVLFDRQDESQESQGELETVFLDGKLTQSTNLFNIRHHVEVELDHLLEYSL
jgi:nicotinamide phosphoribosyltransferase